MRGHIVKRGKNSYSIAISLGWDPTIGTAMGKHKRHKEGRGKVSLGDSAPA